MKVSDVAVEAAAKAYFELGFGAWEGAHIDTRRVEMDDMRVALEAAAPYMLGADIEPKPSDGPDYHAEHAAWEARKRSE